MALVVYVALRMPHVKVLLFFVFPVKLWVLAVIAAVQIGFVALFVSIRQRSRREQRRKQVPHGLRDRLPRREPLLHQRVVVTGLAQLFDCRLQSRPGRLDLALGVEGGAMRMPVANQTSDKVKSMFGIITLFGLGETNGEPPPTVPASATIGPSPAPEVQIVVHRDHQLAVAGSQPTHRRHRLAQLVVADPDLARDGHCGRRMIAGDHHRGDAGRAAVGDRLRRLGTRRIDQRHQAALEALDDFKAEEADRLQTAQDRQAGQAKKKRLWNFTRN